MTDHQIGRIEFSPAPSGLQAEISRLEGEKALRDEHIKSLQAHIADLKQVLNEVLKVIMAKDQPNKEEACTNFQKW